MKFGKWHPFNPFLGLEKGTQLKHYTFSKEAHDSLSNQQVINILKANGMELPLFIRNIKFENCIWIDYLTILSEVQK